ncbi:MAG: hypothetical protein FVQ78_10570 [Solirubrobacterales bacterium]|nr:hypothetical protein [Solirubrobacterales bacterium]
MKRRLTATLLLVLAAALLAPVAAQAVPRAFFGIAPQTALTDTDVQYMRAGRIGSVRWPVSWSAVQPTPDGGYDWSGFDAVVKTAARRRLRVLPFLYATPGWLARKPTTLPVGSARQRRAWAAFLRAAVQRYGPHGEFWREHWAGSGDFVPRVPLREWQVWNEANFFYFAKPASPTRYARLLKISHRAIKRAEPGAKVILSGLFGDPTAKPPNAMSAADFLARLYKVRGIKAAFDGVALHPYAEDAKALKQLTEGLRRVILANRDAGVRLYVTEMGWGSQNDPKVVSFERGIRGQVRELRRAYRYLIANRGRLNLKGVYWFTWKDILGACNFCDSTGLFRRGDRFKPKPAWHAFVRISGGRPRP